MSPLILERGADCPMPTFIRAVRSIVPEAIAVPSARFYCHWEEEDGSYDSWIEDQPDSWPTACRTEPRGRRLYVNRNGDIE